MYIQLLGAHIDFSKNSVLFVEDNQQPGGSEPGGSNPSVPETPPSTGGIVVPDIMPTEYASFMSSYARTNMDDSQQKAVYAFLYKMVESGLMGKIRQLYLPCIMPDWDHCFLNVSKYFNNSVAEYTKMDLYSNTTLGRCFEVCDYGIYRTSSEIKWGDCLTSNWTDADVKLNDWHIFMFKPALQDATTGVHSGGLNFRSRTGSAVSINFNISGAASKTERVRGTLASGSIGGVNIKNSIFTEPLGWGNGTHDPYCVGISIKDNKLVTPGSNYQEFGYNNRNLVNEITEWPLVEGQTLADTSMTGTYGWGGYYGASISMQQNLATSVVSIGLGLTKDEIEKYMEYANEFIVGLRINNDNWDPDKINA
jgi:hypothetical protein